MNKKDLEAHDLLYLLAPPIMLVERLERLFAEEATPASWQGWLERWQVIRSDEPSQLDHTKPSEWKALDQMIKRRGVQVEVAA